MPCPHIISSSLLVNRSLSFFKYQRQHVRQLFTKYQTKKHWDKCSITTINKLWMLVFKIYILWIPSMFFITMENGISGHKQQYCQLYSCLPLHFDEIISLLTIAKNYTCIVLVVYRCTIYIHPNLLVGVNAKNKTKLTNQPNKRTNTYTHWQNLLLCICGYLYITYEYEYLGISKAE